MPRAKGSVSVDFNFVKLNEQGFFDLKEYLTEKMVFSILPKRVRDTAKGLVISGEFYIDGTVLRKKTTTTNAYEGVQTSVESEQKSKIIEDVAPIEEDQF